MNLFIDASSVLAACGSSTGASRVIFNAAESQGWMLQSSPYVFVEIESNLGHLPPAFASEWLVLRPKVNIVPDVITFSWPAILTPAKDRPVLFTAAAYSHALITLDKQHFGELLGSSFYGLPIFTPGEFLRRERALGRWNPSNE